MHKYIHSPEKFRSALADLNEKGQLSDVINAVDNHGDALVHFAARSHSLDVLRILKEYEADFTAVNEHGRQPLHEAIDSVECVSYIVNECNVDVNALKRGDWTPIMIAALKGRLDIIQILEKAGGDLGLCNKDGRTALHLAVQHGHVETAKYTAQQSPACIMKPTKSGRVPIQMAAALCDFGAEVAYDITTFLFDHVPSREILAYNDKSGRGLLQDAVVARNLGLVRFLLNQGANPNQADSIGRSVIHHAAMMGHLDVLELLKSLDDDSLDWDAYDSWDNWTPLMHAARQGHVPIVKFLVQQGLADQNCRDKHGRTAKDIDLPGVATIWNHCDVSEYLTAE